MAKEIIYETDARAAMKAGVDAVAGAVKATLGPRGRSVVLERKLGYPEILDDGAMIAQEIELPDHAQNLGAQLAREAALKTGDVAGDGTTTAIVLTQALVEDGLKNVVAGANAKAVQRGMLRAAELVVEELKRTSRPVRTREERAQVATISCNDPRIGDLIAGAMERVGPEAAITVEEGRSASTTLEVVEGLRFDRGWISPYFVTDAERLEAVLEDCRLLVTDRKVSSMAQLLPVLEKLAEEARPLLLVADDVENEALATLVVNKLRGVLPLAAVRAPGFGESRRELLEDIAVVSGAQVLSDELGRRLEDARPEHLGRAKKAVVGKDETTIIGGGGEPAAIRARAESLKRRLRELPPGYEREQAEQRLGRLSGGVAVISVGAATETELKAAKTKVEDAARSTRAAVEEGVVAGGGAALLRAGRRLEELPGAEPDEALGARIVRRALRAPLRLIAENSGFDGAAVEDAVLGAPEGTGFDAATGRFVDLFQAGIVDPLKVTRAALQNAVSIAGTILTMEALVADRPEDGAGPSADGRPY